MGLEEFWQQSQTKKQPQKNKTSSSLPKKAFISIFVILLIGIGVGLNLPRNKEESRVLKMLEQSPKEIKLPQVNLSDDRSNLKNGQALGQATPSAKLQVLSANLIGIYEQQKQQQKQQASPSASPAQPKLAGVRIIGEVRNIGDQTAFDANVLVHFFDENQNLISTKIGHWKEPYSFLPLKPGETNVYDVLVASPPPSTSVNLGMETKEKEETDKNKPINKTEILKVKDKKLQPAQVSQQGQTLEYYQFQAILTNVGNIEIANPGLYVWMKNEKGKVIGLAAKVFEADLLTPQATIEAKLNLVPASDGEMFDYQIKTFGREL